MPMLNPGVVASSPFLADRFHITKMAETVGDNGRASLTPSSSPAHGIVTQAGPRDLELLPEARRSGAAIMVVTRSQIRDVTPGAAPDVITWRGTDYYVQKVWPYPQFGQGWYKALATSQNIISLMPEVGNAE